jgi:hypothetical protein
VTTPISLVISPKSKYSPLKASDQLVNSESTLPSTPEQAKNPEVIDLTMNKVESFIKNNSKSNSQKPLQLLVIRQPQSLSPEGEQKYLITASPVNTHCIDNIPHSSSILHHSSSVQSNKASPNTSSNNSEQVKEYYLTIRKTPSCLIVEKSKITEPIKESTSKPINLTKEKNTIQPENFYEPVNAMRKIFKSNRKITKYNTSNILNYNPRHSSSKLTPCGRKRKLTSEKVTYTQTRDLKIATEIPPDDAILDMDIIFQEDTEYKDKLDKILTAIDEELWKLGEMDHLLQSYELDDCRLNSITPPLIELLGHDLVPEQDKQQVFSDIFENNDNLKDLFLNPDSINNLKELSKL